MAREATAFAPASVGNVGVGFDILGHAIAGPGDRVTVRRVAKAGVRIAAIRGVVTDLPRQPRRNTAASAVLAWCDAMGVSFGVELEIEKGIALGSGMGGSAASAVAALLAANALLDNPLPAEALYAFALAGEAVASGGRHGDNVGPQLLGGLVLATADRLVRIPVPAGLTCVLAHPPQVLETRVARAALRASYPIGQFVAQSANLALVLTGCHRGDMELIRAGLRDVLVEPRRAPLVLRFAEVQRAAVDAGALGASISGAGPSVFAWCASPAAAQPVEAAMRAAFGDCETWISPVDSPGGRVESHA
jgi:homoserine kinase